MSSSLQNFFTVRNAVEEFGSNAIRMFLLSSSYSQRQAYTEPALNEAVERWNRLERAYDRVTTAIDGPDARTKVEDSALRTATDRARREFTEAMNDDLNTRVALRALFDLATAVNRHIDARDTYDYRGLRSALETFEDLAGGALGFTFGTPDVDHSLRDELIQLLLEVREAERKAGRYERADDLRDRLEALGVTVEDTDDGPRYRV